MMKTRPFAWSVLTVAALLTLPSHAQNNPYADGAAAAPDEWLLVKKGNPWWYETKPSPTPVQLQKRTPTAAEQAIIDRARASAAKDLPAPLLAWVKERGASL